MKQIFYFFLISSLMLSSCGGDDEDTSLGSDATIQEFIIPDMYGNKQEGVVNNETNTISISVAHATDVTSLSPKVSVRYNAKVSPTSGESVDFTNPVTYTVTAENGNIKKYVVSVTVKKSSEARLKNFTIKGFEYLPSFIEGQEAFIALLPWDTDVTTLLPMFNYAGAKISHPNGVPTDFTKPITVTVTAEDGTEVQYSVRAPKNSYAPKLEYVSGPLEVGATVVLKGIFYYEGDDFSMNKFFLGLTTQPMEVKKISKNEVELVIPNVSTGNQAFIIEVDHPEKTFRTRTDKYMIVNPNQ